MSERDYRSPEWRAAQRAAAQSKFMVGNIDQILSDPMLTERERCLRDLRRYVSAHETMVKQIDHWAYKSQLPKHVRQLLGQVWAGGIRFEILEAISYLENHEED
jgi:hypothetical protein